MRWEIAMAAYSPRLVLALAAVLSAGAARAQGQTDPLAPPATPANAQPAQPATPDPMLQPEQPAPAPPAVPAPSTAAPEAPRWRIGGTLGAGWAFRTQYFVVGVTAGFRVAGGLEVGADADGWFHGSPEVLKLSPRLTYALALGNTAPYVGVYYARWFIGDGLGDEDAVGGRLGIWQGGGAGPHTGVGVGVAYEHLLRCGGTCDAWSPEITAAFSF
jgi:hypothetical protein